MAINVGDCVRLQDGGVVMVVKEIISAGLVSVCWDLDERVHEAVYASNALDVVLSENYQSL